MIRPRLFARATRLVRVIRDEESRHVIVDVTEHAESSTDASAMPSGREKVGITATQVCTSSARTGEPNRTGLALRYKDLYPEEPPLKPIVRKAGNPCKGIYWLRNRNCQERSRSSDLSRTS